MNQTALSSHRQDQHSAAPKIARRRGGERRAFAYGDAVRHSSRVRFLRRVLPVLTAVILVLVGMIAYFDPLRLVRELPLDLLRLSISGNKLVMDAPKLSGFTKDGRGYLISAKAAAQDLTQPNVIELAEITASFALVANGSTELTASKGVYNAKTDHVRLTDGIVIRSSSGYEGRLQDATIEVKKGHVVTEQPLDILFNNGSLRADRLEIFDNGARAVFEGRVTMMLRLPPPPASANPEANAANPEPSQ